MVSPITPARYDVEISHRRHDPISYGFRQRSSMWLVDLDALPELPRGLRRLAHFTSRDHLGDARSSLRANLNRFLAEHALPAPARILMLANPRVLGYVFNPLTVFYCYDEHGRLDYTVAEVRNTYGGRHTYLVRTDANERAVTDKVFYVSPFYPVDGHYTMALPEPGPKLTVTVTLHRAGEKPFAAVMQGERSSAPASLWSALRSPLTTRAVMYGIKRHGIALFIKGLRPYPRGQVVPTESDPAGPHTASAELSEAR